MRSSVVFGIMLCVLCVAQTESQNNPNALRLCGRSFVRALVYTCGGSRWKRLITEEGTQLRGKNLFNVDRSTALTNKNLLKNFFLSLHRSRRAKSYENRWFEGNTPSMEGPTTGFNGRVLWCRMSEEWPYLALLNVYNPRTSSLIYHSNAFLLIFFKMLQFHMLYILVKYQIKNFVFLFHSTPDRF